MIYRRWALPILLALSLTLLPSGLAAQTVDEWFQRGNAAWAAGRYREAEQIWRQFLEIEPNNAIAYNNLGIALADQGKLPEAIEAYRRAIALDSNNAIAYYNLGNALRNQGKLPEAIDAYRRAIALDSNYAIAYYNLGNALRNQGKLPEAIDAYRRAIALDSNYAIAYYNLGIALADQGKLPEAIEAYRRAIALNPNYAIAYNNLGVALADQGKLPEAIDAYRRAIALDPNYAIAYYNLGIALADQGKLPEAIEAYRRAIALDSNNAIAYVGLGLALYYQGKLPEAIDAYRRAIALDSNNAIAYNNLGIALADQGKLPEAIEAYRRALALPDGRATPASAHTLAHNALGYTLQQQGDLQSAIAEYKKAIRLDPNYALAYSNLQEAERLLALRGNPLPANPTEILPSLEEEPLFGWQRSTVLIITQTSTGAKTGTGWVVHRESNSTYIITNRHVVSDEDFGKRPSSDIQIELYSHNEPEHRLRFRARIRHITSPNDLLDLAVLEVTGLPDDIEPLRLSNSAIPLDADVRIIGHPVTGSSWTILRGYIAANTPEPNQLNLQIGGTNLAVGTSGSAVIADNQVVGLVVNLSNEVQAAAMEGGDPGASIGGFGFAYPVDVIRQQLQRWGLRF